LKKFKNRNVPVVFQKLKEHSDVVLEDTRFMEVKIWLMHLGENYNGSYFSKESVERAIPTLANTPILGYVEANDEDTDFSDHRSIIVKKDGEFEYKYIGQAYGLIPESNDAKFELRVGDDGVEREYLTCKGLVWRKNDEAVDIFDRDSIKGQSMELDENFTGDFKEDGLFHFDEFKFFGACALGDVVMPAMNSATIEKQFSYNEMHKYIQSQFNEFKRHIDDKHNDNHEDCDSGKNKDVQFNTKQNKGGSNMDREKMIAEFKKILQEKSVENDFGLKSYSQYYIDHNETHLFAQSLDSKLVAIEYSVSEDEKVEISFESQKPSKVEFSVVEEEVEATLKASEIVEYEIATKEKEVEKALTDKFTSEKEVAVGEVQVELTNVKSDFDKLEKEVEGLRESLSSYQSKEKQEAVEAVLEKFTNVFTDEDAEYVEVKNKALEYEKVEDLEVALYTLAGKKTISSFSKKSKEEDKNKNVKINITPDAGNDDNVNPLLKKHFSK
jgi:hypothetical protein